MCNIFMKYVLRDIFFYIASFIYGTGILLIIINSHFLYFINVFFYKMIVGLLITCVVFLLSLKILTFNKKLKIELSYKDILISFLILFFFHFSFISLVIVSLDRSISVLLLSEMADQKNRIFEKKDLEKVYVDIYVKEYDPINRRINEQLSSGNFEEIGSGYRITNRGLELVKVFRFLSEIYPVNKQFLYPSKI